MFSLLDPEIWASSLCLLFQVPCTYLSPSQMPIRPLGQGPAPDVLPVLGLALVDLGKGAGTVRRQVLVHPPCLAKVRRALNQHASWRETLKRHGAGMWMGLSGRGKEGGTTTEAGSCREEREMA